MRMNIDGITSTDNGIKLEARVVMISKVAYTPMGTEHKGTLNPARFGLTAGNLRVDVGNADGAIDNMPGLYGVGGPAQMSMVFSQASSYGKQILEYSKGALVGYETIADKNNAVFARYTWGYWAVAGSYDFGKDSMASSEDSRQSAVHIARKMGKFTAALGYSHAKNTQSPPTWGTPVKLDNSGESVFASAIYKDGPLGLSGALIHENRDDADGQAEFGGWQGEGSASYNLSKALSVGLQATTGEGWNDSQGAAVTVRYALGRGIILGGGVGQFSKKAEATNLFADFGLRFMF